MAFLEDVRKLSFADSTELRVGHGHSIETRIPLWDWPEGRTRALQPRLPVDTSC